MKAKSHIVTSVHIYPVSLPIHTPFSIASGSLSSAQCLFLSLLDEEGLEGIGEAAPFPVLTGDTQESAYDQVCQLAKEILGKTAQEGMEFLLSNRSTFFSLSPTAFTCIEMALWDLHAKRLGLPLAEVWGFARKREAETDITHPIMETKQVAKFWKSFSDFGFRKVKIKVGSGNGSEDLDRVIEIARCTPPLTQFSLDGNQGCTLESALNLVEKIEKNGLRIQFFEQPLPKENWAETAKLRELCPIPICLDESIVTAKDALRAVRENTAQMINLKLMKSGIWETLKIIHIATAAGFDLMIGGMLESEVAMTTSLHMVCGTGHIAWCDLDTPFFMERHPTRIHPFEKRKKTEQSVLTLPSGTGLGLELDKESLIQWISSPFKVTTLA